jgi:hypothetical protein
LFFFFSATTLSSAAGGWRINRLYKVDNDTAKRPSHLFPFARKAFLHRQIATIYEKLRADRSSLP